MTKKLPPLPAVNDNSGSSSEYGLSSIAAGADFDLSGLPGLGSGSGSAKGTDLLHAFIAAGSGQGDSSIAAAIQQALALAGYYGNSTFTPHPGRVLPEDIKAFASALNVLADSNKATPSGAGMPQQNLAQFLSSSAVDGVKNGSYAAQTKVHQYTVRTPNPQALAATFEKVAQQVWDRKPTAAETAQFVRSFSGDFTATQQANNQADYNAQVTNPPLDTGGGANTPTPLQPINPGTTIHPNGGPVGAQLGLGAADTTTNPPDLGPTMQSLQDVIGQNATPTDVMTTANAQELPDAGVAAENFARNLHPKEASANDIGNTMNTFLNLISTKLV